ncbi:MAG: folate-binding protein, partial [Alphaproteobacteria bacterium]
MFLQGLISQDVEKVTQEHAAYGALLTPQGKFLHDFILIASDVGLLLDTEAGRGAELMGRLAQFK